MRFPVVPIGAPPAMSKTERDAEYARRAAVVAEFGRLSRGTTKAKRATAKASTGKIRPAANAFEAERNIARKAAKVALVAERRRKREAKAREEKHARQISLLRFVSSQDLRKKRKAEGRALLRKRGLIA